MRNLTNSLIALAAAGLFAVGSASAQSTSTTTSGAGPGTYDPGHPRVNQINGRETAQQDRIANGIKNGSVNPNEAAHLEKGEQRLENNEKRDMAADGGHLTKQDQRQLNREANHMSRRIYRDKHN